MAERRMFAKSIIDSDAFLDMPLSTQALYFHLSMRADDEGFVNNPKKIQRMIGASEDDAKLLILKRYILTFDSGVIVIKHWKIHNYIQNDRYKPTTYIEEKSQLTLDEKKAYTECIHNVSRVDTQDRIDKVSIDINKKKVVDTTKEKESPTTSTTLNSLLSCFENITLDVDFLDNAYDIDKLIEKVKESSYLQSFNTLSAVLSKYDEIMQDKYKDFGIKRTASKKPEQRIYSKYDMSNLFDDVSQIQL
jgi:hypothetical protein